MKKIVKRITAVILIIAFVFAVFIFGTNAYVMLSAKGQILNEDGIKGSNYDCILVLGAGVRGSKPSPMLRDRLLEGIALYKKGCAEKIIMSGDHGRTDYDEVNVMKTFAIENGVPSEDIFMDHAGFSTYESVYRAQYIFSAKKIIIVTQKYHLYRALFISKKLGLDAVGVNSDPQYYSGQKLRDIREAAARSKDTLYTIFKPKPKYLGDKISLSSSGDETNDK